MSFIDTQLEYQCVLLRPLLQLGFWVLAAVLYYFPLLSINIPSDL